MTADGSPARIAPTSALADRVPPHDEDAERSVLGAMMLSPDAAGHAREMLTKDDFYRPAHGEVFEAASQLYATGQPVDPITLSDQLGKMEVLERVGGRAFVHGLVDSVPSAANVDHYVEIVTRSSLMRRLIKASQQISALGYGPTDDIDRSLGAATQVLYEVVERRVHGGFVPVRDLVRAAHAELEAAFERKEGVTGLRTGFSDLDDLLSGLQRGELIILAARPSIGKTALALNMAVNVAKHGMPVAIFSLEMGGEQLAQRMLCSEAGVDPRHVRHGTLAEEGWGQLFEAAGTLSELDIFIDSGASLGIVELQTKARKLFSGRPAGLVVIDYLQLMTPGQRLSSRQQEIAEISRGLKLMANQLNAPVLALSQLNRAIETRDVKRPQLSDLRESGAIEQDADVVMFLHRDIYSSVEDEDDPNERRTELVVAKNRNGPTDEIELTFLPATTRFTGYAADWSD